MLGNAPTRMVLTVPWAHPETAVASQSNNPVNNPANQRLLTLAAADDHGEDASGVFLLSLLALATAGAAWAVIGDQIREGGVVENASGRVANVEENLVQRAVGKIAVDEFAKLLGVAERGQRTVNQADDFAEMDVGGVAAQLVAAFGSAHAFHHAGVLEFEENQFQKFLRESLFVGDVADPDCSLVMMTGEHHHGLQGVETFLGDFHRRIIP